MKISHRSEFNCVKCLFWSLNWINIASFCFILCASSRFCECKPRYLPCQMRTSSACDWSSCGSSAFELSYFDKAKSWRLCNVRSRRFSLVKFWCEIKVSRSHCHSMNGKSILYIQWCAEGHHSNCSAAFSNAAYEQTRHVDELRCCRTYGPFAVASYADGWPILHWSTNTNSPYSSKNYRMHATK